MDFDDFYRQQREGLVRLCFLATLDRETAADAAQEAMLRAFANWDRLRDQMALAWVRRVALNVCRSRWRRAQRELKLVPRLFTLPARVGPSDPDLVEALRRLPLRQREAVVLRYWGGLSIEECATIMGVSVGAVNQHLTRARGALQGDSAFVIAEGLA